MMIHTASDIANPTLASASERLLWASALVLALAMLSFTVDLARMAGHSTKAATDTDGAATEIADTGAGEAAQGTATAQSGGSTAILTRARADADGTGAPGTPNRKWARYGMTLAWLGGFLLIGAVVTRGLSVDRPPLGNMYEFAMVGAMFAMLVYLLWGLRQDLRWLGAFVTGAVVLVEMAAATVFYTAASQLMPSLRNYWLSIHVTVATLSVGLFIVAFCINLLYLGQEARERGKLRKLGFFRSLPDSAALDRAGYGVLIIVFPLWTFTLIAGAIWAQEAWGHYWTWDPKEVWTLVIWVVYAAYLHARVTAGWSGRKATMIALVGFACVLINFGVVNVFFVGMHSYSGM